MFIEIITYYILSFTNHRILAKQNIEIKRITISLKDAFRKAKESSVFFFNNVLTFTMPRISIILLEYISSTVSVGIYTAGTRFTSGAGLLSGALYNSVYPFIANLKDQKKTSYELAKELIKYSFIIGAAASIALFFLSGILINITVQNRRSKTCFENRFVYNYSTACLHCGSNIHAFCLHGKIPAQNLCNNLAFKPHFRRYFDMEMELHRRRCCNNLLAWNIC